MPGLSRHDEQSHFGCRIWAAVGDEEASRVAGDLVAKLLERKDGSAPVTAEQQAGESERLGMRERRAEGPGDGGGRGEVLRRRCELFLHTCHQIGLETCRHTMGRSRPLVTGPRVKHNTAANIRIWPDHRMYVVAVIVRELYAPGDGCFEVDGWVWVPRQWGSGNRPQAM